MRSALALLAALAGTTLVAAQYDTSMSFVTCSVDGGTGTYLRLDTAAAPLSEAACDAACGTGYYADHPWSYWLITNGGSPTTGFCLCGTDGPAAFQTGVDSGAAPCTGQYFVAKKRTNAYAAADCYRYISVADASRVTSTVTTVTQCWSTCLGYDYAALQSTSSGYNCACGNALTDSGGGSITDATCDSTSWRVFARSSVRSPQASIVVRRQAAALLAARSRDGLCPRGTEACAVRYGEEDYECLDTDSELESCGGCVNGVVGNGTATDGVDCTSLRGIKPGHVTCSRGRCLASGCMRGWSLVGGQCV